ncbi:MAG: hypothetical protein MI741_24530, partial [Rhodospirillales bacterium]|nr:hypothetical protein [Rhodospirillales bacterium]
AGIYATAGTAIIAGVGTAAATMGESLPISLVIGAVIATALFLGGSYSCVMAILPTSFYLPGSHPESWYEDVNEGRYLKDALGEASENYQGYIKSNNDTLSRNAVQFKRGAFLGISAPFFGVLIWLTLYLL